MTCGLLKVSGMKPLSKFAIFIVTTERICRPVT